MEKRNRFWSDANKVYSPKNTPMWTKIILENLEVNENNIEYPDMAEVYEKVSKFFGISKHRFILTNGCENALNIVLSMIRHKDKEVNNFYYEKPGWQLAKYCAYRAGFDDKKIKSLEYMYGSRIHSSFNRETYPIINLYESLVHKRIEENDIVYTTLDYNGWFFHDNINNNRYDDACKAKYRIYDDSYTLSYLRNGKMKEDLCNDEKTTFIVASLSKVFGAGYKLGIILMDESWYNEAMKCAEQYISSSAYTLINSLTTKLDDTDEASLENYGAMIYKFFCQYIHSVYSDDLYKERAIHNRSTSGVLYRYIYRYLNYLSFVDLEPVDNEYRNKETKKFIKDLYRFNASKCKYVSNIKIKDFFNENKEHIITRVQPSIKELRDLIKKL